MKCKLCFKDIDQYGSDDGLFGICAECRRDREDFNK